MSRVQLSLILALVAGTAASAQNRPQLRDWQPPAKEAAKPKRGCGDLKSLTRYEFSISTAELVAAASGVPEHCRVTGQVLPEVRFEVSLPTAWNGRFYMAGNGGYAGQLPPARFPPRDNAMQRGFAVTVTDTGHDSSVEPGASFAVNRQKLIDFAYRAVHVTAVTAKQIIAAYYDTRIERSYFDGCSTGGRQALTEAQRFPDDFDGIVSGAPLVSSWSNAVLRTWNVQAARAGGLSVEKLSILAAKFDAHCDAQDGLADGLVDDPRRCDFRPARDLPKCSGEADSPDCFTSAQIVGVERIFGGVISKRKKILPPLPTVPNLTPGPLSLGANFFQYIAFGKPNPGYDMMSFNFDTDPEKIAWVSGILDATDPDLTRFRSRGAKLLMYFGWADPQLNPVTAIEYYEKVKEHMGPQTGDFFRVFMVPGMAHCGGGTGVSSFDAVTPLIHWVEKGTAPEKIIGSRVLEDKVVRRRPLCPYPQVAKYRGSGSMDDAANFACANP